MKVAKTTIVVCCVSILALDSYAATIELSPIKDNTLFESAAGALSNGAGQHLFVGQTNGGSIRRGLLAFDIGSIPFDSTINSVKLTLNMSRTVASDQNVNLHRLLTDWGESTSDASGQEGRGALAASGDATWIHTFWSDKLWLTTGGDFAETSSAKQSVAGNGTYVWGSTDAMVTDVQSWVNDPSTNFGWAIIGNEAANRTVKRFESRESANETARPKLSVDFTVGIDTLSEAIRIDNSDAIFDLNLDGQVNNEDRRVWVEDIKNTFFGDSNLDGEFNSTDFVLIFQAGEFEDAVEGNSVWATGDWNGNGDFETSDFVAAFQAGGFEQGPRKDAAAVPEPTLSMLTLFGLLLTFRRTNT